MHTRLATAALCTLLSFACDDGEDPKDSGLSPQDSDTPQDTQDTQGSGNLDPCSAEALRQDAIDNGTAVMDGITLDSSTPMADILADTATYDGQFLQIEGTVTEICSNQGCWAALSDGAGSVINLKVVDGTLDFRDETDAGYYAIGEGSFDPDGGHGEQVDLTGAVLGTVYCE